MDRPCNTDKLQVERKIDQLLAIASSLYEVPFKRPAVTWRKSGKNAGTANLTHNRINLNPVLFCHNRDAFFTDVIAHELSHLLVFQLFGRVQPHGWQWQKMMEEVFQRPANTTHNFDLAPLKLKSFYYRCECGPVELSVRRHNKVIRGQQRYFCRRCKQTLIATAEQQAASP